MRTLAAVVLVSLIAATAAAHPGHTELPEVKAEPGTFSYGLMQAQESISLALTYSKERKAEKRLEFAEKRLAEARHMAEQNQTEKAEEVMERYSRQIQQARQVSADLPEQARERVRQDINRTTANHQEVLGEVLEKVPEQARQGINTALENSRITPPEIQREGPGQEMPQGPDETPGMDANRTDDGPVDGSDSYRATGRAIPTSAE